jgi:YidC/Oxa1 family membrane protein insertase
MKQNKKQDKYNLYLALILSSLVILGWNMFYNGPQLEKERLAHEAQLRGQNAASQTPGAQGPASQAPGSQGPASQAPGSQGLAGSLGAGGAGAPAKTRAEALAESPRVALDTPALYGSIALKGGRIDDVSLKAYRETTNPSSPHIVLLSPAGAPEPYYAEAGFLAAQSEPLALPRADTLWRADRAALTPETPVTLSWDNGQGLVFRRKIAVDDRYMFTVTDSVENKSDRPAALAPYALVRRQGAPASANFSILHEGFVGVIGESGVQTFKYDKIEKEEKATKTFDGHGGWLGFTDKYWAATVIPDQAMPVKASFSAAFPAADGKAKAYLADFVGEPKIAPPGGSVEVTTRVFAGAKETYTLDAYEKEFGIEKFDLLIDWGWFYFITRPMFWLLDFLYKFTGNFGVAILLATVLLKTVFFPLANRSYRSMAKMKAVAPKIAEIRTRFPDDKHKQQLETMALYKREKINPVSGCLPMLIQLPVFFALYKVLFITIEMRQAPFFGWIKDLSQPDPTNVFNLFGLLPFDPTQIPVFGSFLALGVWPLIMGVTMFLQMKTNPEPADEMQRKIFTWMPVVFTFTLGGFASGLVIYWAWNNTLSVIQQTMIMKQAGVKIELWDNLANTFRKKATSQ